MTVENTNSTISYTGNNSVTTFAYNFLSYSEDHLFIYLDDIVQSSGFAITGVGDENGGDVIFDIPPGSGVVVRIDRTVPVTQLIEYQEYGPFPAKTNERGLDLGVMIDQQLDRDVTRAEQNKMDKQPSAQEDNIVVFDGEGNSKDSTININDLEGTTAVQEDRQFGDGIATTFNTPADTAAEPTEFLVRLDGLTQRANTDYETDTIGSIEFAVAPGNGVNVDILWYKPIGVGALNNPVWNFDTIEGSPDSLINSTDANKIYSGSVVNAAGRLSAEDKGAAIWEIIPLGVTQYVDLPNGYNVLTLVNFPSLVASLRIEGNGSVNAVSIGAIGDSQGGADNTDVLQFAIFMTRIRNAWLLLPYDAYAFRELNFTGVASAMIKGEYGEELYKPKLRTIGSSTLSTQFGNSVAVMLYDAASSQDTGRGHVLENIIVEEGDSDPSSGGRYHGIYGLGIPQSKWNNVLVDGFDVGMSVGSAWNCNFDGLQNYRFREFGFQMAGASVNGLEIGSLHCTTPVSGATASLDARLGNSVHIGSFVTEGTGTAAHIIIGAAMRTLNIDNIHTESTKDFIVVDVDGGGPTFPFGNVTIDSGLIANAGGAGAMFVKRQGASSNVGLANLNLGAVQIQKDGTTEENYFNMESVANFSTQALMESNGDPVINEYTWYNFGSLINRGFSKSLFGHDGRLSRVDNLCIYNGMPDSKTGYEEIAGASLVAPIRLLDIPIGTLKEYKYEIDVTVQYNSGAFSGRAFWARFMVFQTVDDTVIQTTVASEDLYALNCVFSVNLGNETLDVTNATGFGDFFFRIVSSTNLRG